MCTMPVCTKPDISLNRNDSLSYYLPITSLIKVM